MSEETPKLGRPSSYTAETGDRICERLMEGESLRTICRDEDMPPAATVCRWLGQHEAFRQQYAHAREVQADTLADEALEIADDARNDWMEQQGAEGQTIGWKLNGEHVQRSRLRIDQRRWYAGKIRPKVYGEKVQQEVTGANGGPLQAKVQVEFVNSQNS